MDKTAQDMYEACWWADREDHLGLANTWEKLDRPTQAIFEEMAVRFNHTIYIVPHIRALAEQRPANERGER